MIQTYPRLLHSDKYKLIYAYTSPKHANTWTNDKYTLIYFMILHIDLLYIFSHSHTPTQKPIHTHPHTQAFTHTHSHTPFHTHPFTHTLSHTSIHPHTNAYTHPDTHSLSQSLASQYFGSWNKKILLTFCSNPPPPSSLDRWDPGNLFSSLTSVLKLFSSTSSKHIYSLSNKCLL